MRPFMTDATINSYVGMTTIGQGANGIAYVPGVCGVQNQRAAVVKSVSTDSETGEVKDIL